MIAWSAAEPRSVPSGMRWNTCSQMPETFVSKLNQASAAMTLEEKFASMGIKNDTPRDLNAVEDHEIGEKSDLTHTWDGKKAASCPVETQIFCSKTDILSLQSSQIQTIRKGMIQKLESRLRKKCAQTPYEIAKTAKVLEQLLWKQAKQNVKAYSDATTLNDRLRALMAVVVRRRKHNSTKRSRQEALIGILGRSRFGKIRDLVSSIRLAKSKMVAMLGCYGDDGEVCGRAFGSNFPPAVKRLYFETRLVQAFEKYPTERLEGVDWDSLSTEAERNLLEFQQWKVEHELSLGQSSQTMEET